MRRHFELPQAIGNEGKQKITFSVSRALVIQE